MTLKYFEGFDVHTYPPGASGLVIADQDAWHNWRTGTFGYWRQTFKDGYLGGRAIQVNEYMTAINEANVEPGQTRIRVGWWGTANARSGATYPGSFIQFSANPGGTIYAVYGNFDGTARAYNGTSYVGPASTDTVFFDDPNATLWAYFEVYADCSTGELWMERNGIRVVDVTTMPIIAGGFQGWQFGQIGPGIQFNHWNPTVDHLWVTDGDPLTEGDILGVVINAAQDSYTLSGTYRYGLRGALVIDGVKYQTEWMAPDTLSSQYWGTDWNNMCVNPLFFLENPATNAPWTQAEFDAIEAWGVCFAPSDASTGELRLDALALSRLEWNGGRPLVKYAVPSNLSFYSGNWRKGNPDLTMFAHVSSVPRETVETTAETTSLFCNTVGCILFSNTPTTEEEEPEETLSSIGLTFAEEFREDYTDWKRIDGTGVDYDSYAISGYGVYGDGNRLFQGNYITVNYEAVSNGQAYVQGLWDYTINPDNGRWSMRQLVYFLDDSGHKHFSRKVKIRGHGKALQIKISSQSGKPFTINGWTLYITANRNV